MGGRVRSSDRLHRLGYLIAHLISLSKHLPRDVIENHLLTMDFKCSIIDHGIINFIQIWERLGNIAKKMFNTVVVYCRHCDGFILLFPFCLSILKDFIIGIVILEVTVIFERMFFGQRPLTLETDM